MIRLTEIGRLGKTYGVKGQLRVHSDYDLTGVEFVFLQILGDRVPFKVSSYRDDIVKLDEVDNPEEASKYSGSTLFLEDFYIAEDGEYSENQWMDYTVKNVNGDVLGSIIRIDEYPSQIMATVAHGDTTFLMPIVEDFIENIDGDNNIMTVDLPEGLINLEE